MFYPTSSRVYFYIPADKEGYAPPRNFPHTLAGILLYTRKQRGVNKSQSSTPQPRGYTFIYPQTKRVTHHLKTFSTPSRVYFYIPTNKEGTNNIHSLTGILLCTHEQRELHNTSELSTHPRGYTFIYPPPHRTYVVAPRYVHSEGAQAIVGIYHC